MVMREHDNKRKSILKLIRLYECYVKVYEGNRFLQVRKRLKRLIKSSIRPITNGQHALFENKDPIIVYGKELDQIRVDNKFPFVFDEPQVSVHKSVGSLGCPYSFCILLSFYIRCKYFDLKYWKRW